MGCGGSSAVQVRVHAFEPPGPNRGEVKAKVGRVAAGARVAPEDTSSTDQEPRNAATLADEASSRPRLVRVLITSRCTACSWFSPGRGKV